MFNMNVFCLYSLYYLFYWDSNAVILDIKSATVVSSGISTELGIYLGNSSNSSTVEDRKADDSLF